MHGQSNESWGLSCIARHGQDGTPRLGEPCTVLLKPMGTIWPKLTSVGHGLRERCRRGAAAKKYGRLNTTHAWKRSMDTCLAWIHDDIALTEAWSGLEANIPRQRSVDVRALGLSRISWRVLGMISPSKRKGGQLKGAIRLCIAPLNR
jgi:hypothetical protein